MAPGSNNPLDTKPPHGRGQRSLAAIVFTDVVSFSALHEAQPLPSPLQ